MMTPEEFGEALGWPRTLRRGAAAWESERGTYVSVHLGGSGRVRVTHRLTAEEWWVPCDAVGLRFAQEFDADRPSA